METHKNGRTEGTSNMNIKVTVGQHRKVRKRMKLASSFTEDIETRCRHRMVVPSSLEINKKYM